MVVTTPPPTPPPPPTSKASATKYSQCMPFLRRPFHLTGEYAGDVGFDPLNLASSPERLLYHREAEIKHGRLAMLAAAGWPISEVYDAQITNWIDNDFGWEFHPALLSDGTDRVPSLLNGGMDNISPYFWGFCLGLTAAIDIKGIQNSRFADEVKGYNIPGDYGFDPLGLYPSNVDGRKRMELAEIKHGRLGMIAITAFAFQEYVSGLGVIDETPVFFRPLFQLDYS